MSRVARISLACAAIVAWVACARSVSAFAQASLHQQWSIALFLLFAAIGCASLGLWLSEYLVGSLLNQRTIVAVSVLPLVGQKAVIEPAHLTSANDTLTAEELRHAHNDQV